MEGGKGGEKERERGGGERKRDERETENKSDRGKAMGRVNRENQVDGQRTRRERYRR